MTGCLIVLAMTLIGCPPTVDTPEPPAGAAYFADPQQAVTKITELLRAEDYRALAAYYDLSGTEVKRADLVSGEFFIRKQRPPSAHPAGFWRYKHPFAPGYKYSAHTPVDSPGVYTVEVTITIDQGAGQPPQRGFDRFLMRKSERGWQVLPVK
jgi:hypothetical protein